MLTCPVRVAGETIKKVERWTLVGAPKTEENECVFHDMCIVHKLRLAPVVEDWLATDQ
jgi:hypothetical protein